MGTPAILDRPYAPGRAPAVAAGGSAESPFRHPALAMGVILVGGAIVVGSAAAFGPAPGIAALLAVALGVVVLQRPDVGALVLVAVVPTVAGLARGYPIPALRVGEVLLGGLSVLILLTAQNARAVPWRAFDWCALAYALAHFSIGLYSMLKRGVTPSTEELGTLVSPIQFFLLYRAVMVGLPTSEDRRRGLRLLIYASVPVSALALLQVFGVGPVRDLLETATSTTIFADSLNDGVGRATGPYNQPHSLGGYLFLVTLLCVGLLLEGSGRVMPRARLVVLLGVSVAGLASTVVFAPILGALAGVLVLAFLARRMTRLLVGLAIFGTLGVLAFGSLFEARLGQQYASGPGADRNALVPNTVEFRYQVWTEQYIPTLDGRWLAGYGVDLPPGPDWEYMESLYVSLLLRGGLPLLLLYGALTVALVAAALRVRRTTHDADQAVVARVLVVAVAVLGVLHLVQAYFLQTGPPHLLWGLMAMVLAGDPLRRDGAS